MSRPHRLPAGGYCPATCHGTIHAYRRYGCRCPDVVDRERARNRAKATRRTRGRQPLGRRHGYDPTVLERALAGDLMVLTPAETRAAVEVLTGRRMSAEQTARRIGVSPRTVRRHRAALREAA